jgi:hypothetical protein
MRAEQAKAKKERLRIWSGRCDTTNTLAPNRLIADLPEDAWRRLGCGAGSRGPRTADWAAIDIRPLRHPGDGHWLPARRSISDPGDIAYHLYFGARARISHHSNRISPGLANPLRPRTGDDA